MSLPKSQTHISAVSEEQHDGSGARSLLRWNTIEIVKVQTLLLKPILFT